MSRCHVCGSTEFREELTSEVFHVDGRPVLVEDIPVRVCDHCGEKSYSRETTERVRRMVRGETEPSKSIEIAVFTYA